MSKGSKQRPLKVSKEQMEESWNRIFGKKDEKASKTKTDNATVRQKSRPRTDKGS